MAHDQLPIVNILCGRSAARKSHWMQSNVQFGRRENERTRKREGEEVREKFDAPRIDVIRILMMKNGRCICNNSISVNLLVFFCVCVQSNRSNFLSPPLRDSVIQFIAFNSSAIVTRISKSQTTQPAAHKYLFKRSGSLCPFEGTQMQQFFCFHVCVDRPSGWTAVQNALLFINVEGTCCLLVIHLRALVCTRGSTLNRQNSLITPLDSGIRSLASTADDAAEQCHTSMLHTHWSALG